MISQGPIDSCLRPRTSVRHGAARPATAARPARPRLPDEAAHHWWRDGAGARTIPLRRVDTGPVPAGPLVIAIVHELWRLRGGERPPSSVDAVRLLREAFDELELAEMR